MNGAANFANLRRIKMDIPELVGQWEGPKTNRKYVVPIFGKIILIDQGDRNELQLQYGDDKLPIV